MRCLNLCFWSEIKHLRCMSIPPYFSTFFTKGNKGDLMRCLNLCFWSEIKHLRCMSIPPYFSTFFTKGNNLWDFLFVSLHNKALPKNSSLKGKNLLQMEQILSFKRELYLRWEANIKNGTVASLTSVSIHLKLVPELSESPTLA